MAKPKGTHFVISANFLDSGAPAYLGAGGAWTTDLQQAHPAADAAERDRLLAEAAKKEGVVCDAYAFDVRLDGGVIDPLTAREEIRAKGPSVAYRRPDPTRPGASA